MAEQRPSGSWRFLMAARRSKFGLHPLLDIGQGRHPFVAALNRDDRDNVKWGMLVEIIDPSSGRRSRVFFVAA